jgi:ribosomal protein S18
MSRIDDDLDDKGDDRRGGKGGRGGGGGGMNRRKVCRFCAETTTLIDYKNPQLLRSFVTDRGKMVPRRHQRLVRQAPARDLGRGPPRADARAPADHGRRGVRRTPWPCRSS